MTLVVNLDQQHLSGLSVAALRVAGIQHEKTLEIKRSTIPNAGLGLFTTQACVKGTVLCEYKGVSLSNAELKHLYPLPWVVAPYVAKTPWGAIDACDPNPSSATYSKARFINDCTMQATLEKTSKKSPLLSATTSSKSSALLPATSLPTVTNHPTQTENSTFVSINDKLDKTQRGVFVVATRDIPAKTEVFVAYGHDYWGSWPDFYRNAMLLWLIKHHESHPNGIPLVQFAKHWSSSGQKHLINKLVPAISEVALKQGIVRLEPCMVAHLFQVISLNA